MIYDKKCEYLKKNQILYVVRLEPTISTLTTIRSIQMAKRDSDGYRIRKYFILKSILFIMFANLKLVLRSYTSLYGIFMSASLTLYIYTSTSSWFTVTYMYVCIQYEHFKLVYCNCTTLTQQIHYVASTSNDVFTGKSRKVPYHP